MVAFVQFAAANRGVGPVDKQQLTEFMVSRSGLNAQDADAVFVPPRSLLEMVSP